LELCHTPSLVEWIPPSHIMTATCLFFGTVFVPPFLCPPLFFSLGYAKKFPSAHFPPCSYSPCSFFFIFACVHFPMPFSHSSFYVAENVAPCSTILLFPRRLFFPLLVGARFFRGAGAQLFPPFFFFLFTVCGENFFHPHGCPFGAPFPAGTSLLTLSFFFCSHSE